MKLLFRDDKGHISAVKADVCFLREINKLNCKIKIKDFAERLICMIRCTDGYYF